MKTSLKDSVQQNYAAEQAAPASAETAIAVVENETVENQLVANESFFNNDDLVGEWSSKDLILPRLNIVHGVGGLSEHFSPGQLVINRSQVVGSPTQSVELTVLRIKKYYEEKLPFQSEVMPRVFQTEAAARQAGLTTTRNKVEGCGIYQEVGDCELLVKSPNEDDPEGNFLFEFGGNRYARVLFTVKGVSFRAANAFLTTSVLNRNQGGLAPVRWSLVTERVKFGTNMTWIPRVQVIGRNSPEFVAWVREMKV